MSNLNYVALTWSQNRWTVEDCPMTSGDKRAVFEEWIVSHPDLPRPKRMIGDTVSFSWDEDTLRGEIRSINLSAISSSFSWEPPQYKITICYTVYANGHGRWVDECYLLGD